MTTTDIFKKIYQDLKEEFTKENNNYFLKEYTIPSINYQENSNGVNDLYFASGIEMELDRMMNFFENKVFYMSYKDKYIFSNNEEKLQEIIAKKVEKEVEKETQNLKEKFDEKIEEEFREFIIDLKERGVEVVATSAYEIVTKEEMIDNIKERDYKNEELKILLKTDGILDECYDEWLKTNSNYNELLEYPVDKRLNIILDNYKEKTKAKDRESR